MIVSWAGKPLARFSEAGAVGQLAAAVIPLEKLKIPSGEPVEGGAQTNLVLIGPH